MIEVFKIIHNLYDIESSPKLFKSSRTGNRGDTLKLFTRRAKTNIRKYAFPIRVTEPWNSLPETEIRTGNKGHTVKLCIQRAKTNIRKNAFPIRVSETWNSLPKTVIHAKSVNTFKNRLDYFLSNQEILYNFEAPLKIDDEEYLIIEESRESCNQSHL